MFLTLAEGVLVRNPLSMRFQVWPASAAWNGHVWPAFSARNGDVGPAVAARNGNAIRHASTWRAAEGAGVLSFRDQVFFVSQSFARPTSKQP